MPNLTIMLELEERISPDGTGSLAFKFEDCIATIRDGDNSEVGYCGGTIGADYEFQDRRVKAEGRDSTQIFVVRAKGLWNAFQQALVEEGLVEEARAL